MAGHEHSTVCRKSKYSIAGEAWEVDLRLQSPPILMYLHYTPFWDKDLASAPVRRESHIRLKSALPFKARMLNPRLNGLIGDGSPSGVKAS